MSRERRIVLKFGQYELEIGKQVKGSKGDVYHIFTLSEKGLHASIHRSGRIHLRGQKDSTSGFRITDVRFDTPGTLSSQIEIVEDILKNAFFVPTSYQNAFAVNVPKDFASLVDSSSWTDLRVDVIESFQQFIDSFVPLETEDDVLKELSENTDPHRTVMFVDPQAGLSLLLPPTSPQERPLAFSPKWFTERTIIGREMVAPSNQVVDTGMSMTQEALTNSLGASINREIVKRELDRLVSDPKFKKVVEHLPSTDADNERQS